MRKIETRDDLIPGEAVKVVSGGDNFASNATFLNYEGMPNPDVEGQQIIVKVGVFSRAFSPSQVFAWPRQKDELIRYLLMQHLAAGEALTRQIASLEKQAAKIAGGPQ